MLCLEGLASRFCSVDVLVMSYEVFESVLLPRVTFPSAALFIWRRQSSLPVALTRLNKASTASSLSRITPCVASKSIFCVTTESCGRHQGPSAKALEMKATRHRLNVNPSDNFCLFLKSAVSSAPKTLCKVFAQPLDAAES